MLRDIAACWDNVLTPLHVGEEITFVEPAHYTPEIEHFLEDYFNTGECPARRRLIQSGENRISTARRSATARLATINPVG